MGSIKYNKLIRDRIPEIIEASGKKPMVEKLEGEVLLEMLDKKLWEELEEYKESGQVEELADLVEVVEAILEYKRVSLDEFHRIKENKRKSRGGFERGLLLIEVTED